MFVPLEQASVALFAACGLPVQPILSREEPSSKKEAQRPSPIKVYLCDPHSLDTRYAASLDGLRTLYEDVARDRVSFIRYDFKWRDIEPARGGVKQEQLQLYSLARDAMKAAGLGEPTIILSNIPQWAEDLYKKNKEAFFDAWRNYVLAVRASLEGHEGKVSRVQVLNELNVSYHTPVASSDIPRFCTVVRDEFASYNPALQLSATILAGNLADLGERARFTVGAKRFLEKNKKMLQGNFDAIGIDYYPGLWHLPLHVVKDARWDTKAMFVHMQPLREVLEEVASWDKEYHIGEVGLPTRFPWNGERAQRYFFNVFFRSLKRLLIDFEKRGLRLPSAVGLYEVIDREPTNLRERIAKAISAEYDLGMRRTDGSRKLVLQESSHRPQVSRLRYLIAYLNKPLKPKRQGLFHRNRKNARLPIRRAPMSGSMELKIEN